MTLEELKEFEHGATRGPWRYVQLLDGIESRALLDGTGYHFGQIDDLNNGDLIAALRNKAPALIKLWEVTREFYNQGGITVSRAKPLADALAELEK